ncbi:MAG: hypothetical protein BMS9Abin05_2101 [Rhodothermia bacterium]|nr:MAG: hypothetical protein BMS9Abin05_2101 [Rhodothermia bacterium]
MHAVLLESSDVIADGACVEGVKVTKNQYVARGRASRAIGITPNPLEDMRDPGLYLAQRRCWKLRAEVAAQANTNRQGPRTGQSHAR